MGALARMWRYESKRWAYRWPLFFDTTLSQIMRRGYVVIPKYWSQKMCLLARNSIDEFIERPDLKVWKDEIGADKRLMGANTLHKNLDLFSDNRLTEYMNRLFNCKTLTGFSMGSRLDHVVNNLGSGQGWHRDIAVNYQFKAILYLSDVNATSGPFQYLRGSGNALSILREEYLNSLPIDQNRFTDEESELFDVNKIDELRAKAGTLIIANTRGIHRGKSIEVGSRYALTNYYWEKKIPKHIQPFVNGMQ